VKPVAAPIEIKQRRAVVPVGHVLLNRIEDGNDLAVAASERDSHAVVRALALTNSASKLDSAAARPCADSKLAALIVSVCILNFLPRTK
jgi:hypothetical protein